MHVPQSLLSVLFLAILLSTAGCGSEGSTGDACDTAEDCEDSQCILGGSFPEGLCTPACENDADCPGGFTCISRSGGICLRNCDSTEACEAERGAAWQCREESREEGGGNALVCIGD
jgi:hypothetical protein